MTSWTQEDAVAFESARECLTDLIGFCSADLHAERNSGAPNETRIAALEYQMKSLATERSRLRGTDIEAIARIRNVYGAEVRRRRQLAPNLIA